MSRKDALARLGAEVARVRADAQMSQAAFAAALDVHRTTVARWETGARPIDGRALAAIESRFGVRVVFSPDSG